jgi:predicted nicotinamide N-methyase
MPQIPSIQLLSELAPFKPVPGCPGIIVHQAENVFNFWHAWEKELGKECDVPYWATVWPASIVLARYLLDHPEIVNGKSILDIGCGAGVVAIASVKAGARSVIANDNDSTAIHMTKLNAEANSADITFDKTNLISSDTQIDCDIILAADMFYHRPQAEAMLRYLRQSQKNSVRVIVSDAERPFAPAKGITVLAEEIVSVNKELEGVGKRNVRILELVL